MDKNRRLDNSSVFESDFSDDYDSTTTSSDESVAPVKHKKKEVAKKRSDCQLLVVTTEEIVIDDETKILIDSDKNCRITLPVLHESSSTLSDKGQIYDSNAITIMTKKSGLEHVIMSSKGNYINGHSLFYTLKGGNSVTFYSAGRSWYADR